MTAINILKSADAVHLVTDGLVGDGVGVGLTSKVATIPHLNAAIATRGPARLLGLMSLLLTAKARSFDGLFEELHKLPAICAELVEEWQIETVAADFDVAVVGIGKEGPAAFFACNHGEHGLQPWTVIQVDQLATPAVDDAIFKALYSADDPLGQMPHLLAEQQRLHPHVIGGFCQVTSVTTAEVRSRILPIASGVAH